MNTQSSNPLIIDGSHGEGGGQVLRSSLTLSILTGRPIRVEHIRAGRRKPGLRPQHLTAVRAAATICDAHLEGDALGAQTLTFAPSGPAHSGDYIFDVTDAAQGGSAGSVGLVLQTVLLPLTMAPNPSDLTLHGGTHVPWVPSASYLTHVFLPLVSRMGVSVQLKLNQWGFYPAGGGEIQVHITGSTETLGPVTATGRGELKRIWGEAVVTNLPSHIPQRMANRAHNVLAEAGLQARIKPRRLRGTGPGAGIFLFAEYAVPSSEETITAGFTAYGRKGLPAERVAEAACQELMDHHTTDMPIDPHLADQLIVPMALAKGTSTIRTSRITQHLLTNMWVIRQFLVRKIDVTEQKGTPGTITITRIDV